MIPNISSRQQLETSSLAALFSLSDRPNSISFSGGYPDPALFPKNELKNAFADRIKNSAPDLFQYQSVLGNQALRKKIAAYVKRLSIQAQADQIMLTQGGQEAIKLLASLFLDPHDGIAVEGPTYIGAVEAFNEFQPTYYEIPMQPDGLDLVLLEEQLKKHFIKLIYVIPNFQNPTGYCMSLAKRKRLANLASQYHALVIEDDPYRELRYGGIDLPPVKAFDRTGNVIMVNSFSKILSPALRCGWLLADQKIIKALSITRLSFDCQSPNVILEAIDQYLTDNSLKDHIKQLRCVYHNKLQIMLASLTKYLPKNCTFSKPQGGFFVWVTIPKELDAKKLLDLSRQVTFLPGNDLFVTSHEQNHLRLNFTGATKEQIQLGCQELGKVIQHALQPAIG
jgi:DNA-binding transcriptional MocR family regulator